MAPDSGEVTVDGVVDGRRIRESVALVDAPDISAPADDLPLAVVLREEMLFAGVRGGVRRAREARRLLAEEDLVAYRGTPMVELPSDVRMRALTQAAVRRPSAEGVVIVSPDRHGGDPLGWYDIARDLADGDLAVVVLAGAAAVDAVAAIVPGARDAHEQVHEDVAAEHEATEGVAGGEVADRDGEVEPGTAQTRTMAAGRRRDDPSRQEPQEEGGVSDPEPADEAPDPDHDRPERPDDDHGPATEPAVGAPTAPLLRRDLRERNAGNDEEETQR
jgi:hypothetical protein